MYTNIPHIRCNCHQKKMTHHFVMTSSLLIKNFIFHKFGDFSSDIDFKTKMNIFGDDVSLMINQCNLQAPEGSLWMTQSVRQPRSASKRSALVLTIKTRLMYIYLYIYIRVYIYIYICNELIEETARHRKLIFDMWKSFGYGSSKF